MYPLPSPSRRTIRNPETLGLVEIVVTIQWRRLWRGHYALVVVFETWCPWYAWINQRLAIATRPIEFIMIDRQFAETRWPLKGGDDDPE